MEAEAVGWPAGASRPDSTCRLPDLWSTSSFIMSTASRPAWRHAAPRPGRPGSFGYGSDWAWPRVPVRPWP